jgi:hypothetical protein
MPAPRRPRLILLGRPDCELCEDFAAALLAAFGEACELVHEDVDARPEWQRRWGLKIPVLLDARGELVCAERFDAAEVAAALRV